MTIRMYGWIGAHSAGKTTTVNRVHRFLVEDGRQVIKIPEVARLYPGKIGKNGGFSAQLWMIQEQMRLEMEAVAEFKEIEISESSVNTFPVAYEQEVKYILCDRTIWDMLAYSISLNRRELISDTELQIIKTTVLGWDGVKTPYDTVFFCEKKPLYDDGVRDTDPAWQDDIHQTFKTMIKEYDIKVVTVQ
jgi:hypothetical protein